MKENEIQEALSILKNDKKLDSFIEYSRVKFKKTDEYFEMMPYAPEGRNLLNYIKSNFSELYNGFNITNIKPKKVKK